MTWRNRAACLDERPELFFPIGNGHTALLLIEKAKAACRRCEIAETCLTWAMESDQDTGIWGGNLLRVWGDVERVSRRIQATSREPGAEIKR